jgi:hypothetical protein
MWALLTSKLGAWAAGIVAVVTALGTVILEARHAGVKSQQAADDTAKLKEVETAHETSTAVAVTPIADQRRELQQWTGK